MSKILRSFTSEPYITRAITFYKICFRNHDLRVPKQEWLELPAMAIKCTLWGLNFTANDIDLASKLNTIFNQAVVARIKVNLLIIYLFRVYKSLYKSYKIYTKYRILYRKTTVSLVWLSKYLRTKHVKNYFTLS